IPFDPVGSTGIRPDSTGLKLVPDCNPYYGYSAGSIVSMLIAPIAPATINNHSDAIESISIYVSSDLC
ncbi:hypothetical protein AVEN_190749-1, partial [Araneus ventricosus]